MRSDNTSDPSLMVPYCAARTPEYDRIYQKPERQGDIAMVREMLPPLFAGKRVLEIACGTGFWTQFIACADGAPARIPDRAGCGAGAGCARRDAGQPLCAR